MRRLKVKKLNNFNPYFIAIVFTLLLMLILRFSTTDLLVFYIAFEARLIPIFTIILGWGYQPERIKASLYILFYTVAGSLPLFAGIIILSASRGGVSFATLGGETLKSAPLVFMISFAFLVKFPIYGVHL